MIDHHLRELARLCGIAPHWRTHWGDERSVAQHDLARMLSALGYPSGNKSELSDSRARALRNNASRVRPPLIVMNAGERVRIPADGVHSRIGRVVMDDGACIDMRLDEYADGLVLGAALDKTGYHRLIIDDRETLIAVAPQRCFTLDDIAPNARMWGLTAQIHALRMPGDRGSGGFGAIGALATSAARQGADAIAISPSHALFCADSHHFSPYSPSTRFFLNTAHIDLAATFSQDKIAHAIHVADIANQMARLEALELVDWPGANTTRRKLHAALYQWFRDNITHDAHLNQDYRGFSEISGSRLVDHARFEALHAHYYNNDFTRWDWRMWDAGHRDPASPDVQAFAQENHHAINFHVFLQWLAFRSQSAAQRKAKDSGMRIGLIGDLAVGVNSGGSHAWSAPDELLDGLSVGAPPDPLAPQGQSWGLTAFSPRGLVDSGFAPFIATLRAMMVNAGGVRIDHAMGLARLWLSPAGEDASHGADVSYPFEDMLRLVALESQRHRAIVIGEDLGTVPEGFRERLESAGVYGMRVMQFERDHDGFRKPQHYTRGAASMTSTHDTPTIAGWWRGRDLEMREQLEFFGPGQNRAGEDSARAHDRYLMRQAFLDAGVCDHHALHDGDVERVADAAVAFIAQAQCALALAPLEDALAEEEQPNLPGTVDQHPNWCRRNGARADMLLESPQVRARLTAMARARNRQS
jgi:4-alpha-glucanotransferase